MKNILFELDQEETQSHGSFRSLGFSGIASYLKGKLQFNNNCWMNVSILSRSCQPSKGETRYSLFIPSVALDDGDQYFSPL